MIRPNALLSCCSILLLASALAASPAGDYAAELQESLDRFVPVVLLYTADAAKECARHLTAGGTFWLAGDRGFVLEGLNRAGGLMAAKWLKKPEDIKPGDFVLMGLLGEPSETDRAVLDRASTIGARVLVLGPVSVTGGTEYLLSPSPLPDPAKLPLASPVLAASLWTFTAELIAALTREGKMPPMYQSVLVPGGRERNAEHLKLQWEPAAPEPIPPLVLGRTYLARLGNILRRLRATQLDEFAAAGELAAEAIRSGHTAWYCSLGHLPPELPGQPGDPGVLKPLKMNSPDKLGDFVKPGDVVLYVGYYEPHGPWVEAAHGLGAKIVTVVSGTPERRAGEMGADINICGCWPYGDALLDIPGYDIKVLPPSGVIQSAAYHMLVAETAHQLQNR